MTDSGRPISIDSPDELDATLSLMIRRPGDAWSTASAGQRLAVEDSSFGAFQLAEDREFRRLNPCLLVGMVPGHYVRPDDSLTPLTFVEVERLGAQWR